MKRLLSLIYLPLSLSTSIWADIVKNYGSTSDSIITVDIDSIDFRQDLTRVYCRLCGAPHTSGRIDEASIYVDKSRYRSADVDGVDFRRYFQWEDNGVIPIEIDFPAMPQFEKARISLSTPRGESITDITRK